MVEISLRILAVIGLCYLALVAVTFVLQRKLIYHPTSEVPSLAHAGLTGVGAVTLTTSDGLGLLAWHKPAQPGQPSLLYFHGNAGDIGDRAAKVQPYLAAGFGLLLVEYRGYGGNPGRPAETGLYADAAAALAFLEDAGVPMADIVIYGESLGAAVAVETARDRAVRAVILEAPFTALADVGAKVYPYLPVRLLTLDKFDSLAKIDQVTAPLVVIHGEQDALVPVAMGRAMLAAANPPKRGIFLPNNGHSDFDPVEAATQVGAALRDMADPVSTR